MDSFMDCFIVMLSMLKIYFLRFLGLFFKGIFVLVKTIEYIGLVMEGRSMVKFHKSALLWITRLGRKSLNKKRASLVWCILTR
jgi:hypothetical protein